MAFEISINNLPIEIIEMFAPDLSTSTLNILRLVNKRFYSVFSQGKFWKCHLLFPEKQFLCDVRSNSKVSGVKDVLEEIAQGRINKIQGYFKLQNVHLKNWLSGSIQDYDIIDLIPSTVSRMKEIVDDENERWLVFSANEHIHIWNITAKPCPLTPVNIGPHSKLNVLPGGKLLLKDNTYDKYDGLVAIYKFENSSINLQYKFAYYMDSKLDALQEPTPGSCLNFRFIVIGNYFIGYNCEISSYHGNLLHFWNLDCCTKKGSISLSELDCNNEFQDLVKEYGTAEENDITRSCKGCYINLHQGIYPNVLVRLRYPCDRLSVVSIFNVELMRVTHIIDTFESNIISCSMNCDKVSVVAYSHVINFSVLPIAKDIDISYGQQLTFIECENVNKNNILFKNSNMLLKLNNKVDIVSLATETFSTKTIDVDASLSILGFLEPKFVLMYDFDNPTATDVKVYYVPNGKEIFSWTNVNIGGNTFLHYYRNLEYLSKLVFNFNEEKHFTVFNF